MAKNNNPLGLDPKKMRVESVDKNFTTLRHKDGHQIRIAHNVLSPESRKALAAFGKTATESMTPVQARQAQESNKANSAYAEGGPVRNTMPRGMTYADGGKVPIPTQDQQNTDTSNTNQTRMQQVKQGAEQSGGMPSAEELANRLKNFWAEGGEVPHNMPDNVTGYAEGGQEKKPEPKKKEENEEAIDKSQPQMDDGEIRSNDETVPILRISFAKGGDVDDESELVHYSRTPGLKSLDPSKMGTSGVRGAQYKRGVPKNKSTFFYTKNSEPESDVVSGAKAKYNAKLTPEHKVYDLSKDPEKAMEHVRHANQGAFNEDMLHEHLKSKGYHGVKWQQSKGTKVVQMYHPMDVTEDTEGYAKGGTVQKYADGTPDALVSPEDRIPGDSAPMSVQPDQPADIGNVQGAMSQEPQAPNYDDMYRQNYQNYKATYPNLDEERIRDLALHETEKNKKISEAHEANLKATEGQRQSPINMENARRQSLGLAPITESGMAVSPEQMRAMAPETAAQDQTPPVQDPNANPAPQAQAAENATAVPEQGPAAAQVASVAPGQISPEQQRQAIQTQRHQEMTDEDMKWQEDLKNQHITPMTYSRLFHYQDGDPAHPRGTLGKIGMAFGALLSGAGAGLAHQAPAFMQIFNNEIANDLNAQMQSKQNAQNFLRIGQQAALNRANVRQLNVDSAMKEFALTRMRMNNSALHSLINTRDWYGPTQPDFLPNGQRNPQAGAPNPRANPAMYQNADKGLAMINSAVQSENYNLADRYSTNSSYMNMVMGGDGGAQSPAQQIRQKQLMGVMSQEQANESLKEAGMVENHVQANNGMLNSFDRVDQLQHMSKYMNSPAQTVKQISAEWDSALDKFVKQNEGRVTPQTVQLMKSLKPKLTDSPETVQVKRAKLNSILNEGFATPMLDSFGIRTSKGEYTPNTTGQMKPQYKLFNGVWYQRGPDGKAVPVK